MNSDLVVIGCGAGGWTSALAFAEKGRNVAVVYDRIPSTALFSGAGYNLEVVHQENFVKAVTFFKKNIEAAGFPISYSEKKRSLLTESGGLIETKLYSSLSAPAELNSILHKKVLFIGIKNLQSFIPELIILRLKKHLKAGTDGWNFATLNLSIHGVPQNLTSVGIAKLFDIKENFENFINMLLNLKEIQSYDVVLLPPILGINNYNENYRTLRGVFKPYAGELLSSIPSVQGLRLYNTMERALREKNLRVISGRCTGFTGNGEIKSIKVVTQMGATLQIEGENFIYSPGRFIGGGISSGKEIREALFDLPLYYYESRINSYFHSLFTYNYRDHQPCLHARILVNQNFQPLKEDGNVFAENLYLSGSITQNSLYDGITGAIVSGYFCARSIV